MVKKKETGNRLNDNANLKRNMQKIPRLAFEKRQ